MGDIASGVVQIYFHDRRTTSTTTTTTTLRAHCAMQCTAAQQPASFNHTPPCSVQHPLHTNYIPTDSACISSLAARVQEFQAFKRSREYKNIKSKATADLVPGSVYNNNAASVVAVLSTCLSVCLSVYPALSTTTPHLPTSTTAAQLHQSVCLSVCLSTTTPPTTIYIYVHYIYNPMVKSTPRHPCSESEHVAVEEVKLYERRKERKKERREVFYQIMQDIFIKTTLVLIATVV